MSTPLHAVEPPYRPPTPPPEPPQPDEPFPLLDYLQLLWFRRRLIGLVTLLVALMGYLYVNQLQSIYTARSDILIGVTDTQPLDFQQAIYQRYFGLDTQQEMEILRSRRLAEKTIERLNLLSVPEFNPSLRSAEESESWTRFLNPRNWIPDGWSLPCEALRRERWWCRSPVRRRSPNARWCEPSTSSSQSWASRRWR